MHIPIISNDRFHPYGIVLPDENGTFTVECMVVYLDTLDITGILRDEDRIKFRQILISQYTRDNLPLGKRKV